MDARRPQESLQPIKHAAVAKHVALPDNQYGPAHLGQCRLDGGIARAIVLELQPPVVHPGVRECRAGTPRMTVPEAAMNEYHLPAPTEDDVGPPGKIPSM